MAIIFTNNESSFLMQKYVKYVFETYPCYLVPKSVFINEMETQISTSHDGYQDKTMQVNQSVLFGEYLTAEDAIAMKR